MAEYTSPVEALTHALVLAVTAPDNERAHQATALAEQIAANLSDIEVQRAKNAANQQLNC